MNNRFPANRQKGISLLSLMVASAIGIFLVGGILKVYVDSKNSFTTRNALAGVAENTRFALDDMRRILIMAGRGIGAGEDDTANRRSLPGMVTEDDAKSGSDVVAVRYRRGPSCGSYQNVDLGQLPTEVRFFVNNNDELVCKMAENGTWGQGRVLASGVKKLRILYGVDEQSTSGASGDTDRIADRYLTAAEIEAMNAPPGRNTPWARVVSMRIGLIMESEEETPANAPAPSTTTLKLFGETYPSSGTLDKQHIYRIATTTFTLRNFNPMVQRQ